MRDQITKENKNKEKIKDEEKSFSINLKNKRIQHQNINVSSFVRQILENRKDLFSVKTVEINEERKNKVLKNSKALDEMFRNESSVELNTTKRNKTRNKDQLEVFTDEEICEQCNLREITFSEMPENPLKVAEASFSDVFLINNLIYKIIPFNQWYTLEAFCKEVFVLENIKNESGVCKLYDKFVLKGKFSEEYLNSWEQFKKTENKHPSEYSEKQKFGVLVLEQCGTEVEKYVFSDFSEILNFIEQLLRTVQNLERKFKFEHRDMHWGNILVKEKKMYLIDFNFSRIETSKILYTDLNTQDWLFEGDSQEDIQFQVYVDMKRSCKGNWRVYNPKSNLLWIRYILIKLLGKTDQENYKKMQKIIEKSKEYGTLESLLKWHCKYIKKREMKELTDK